METLRAYVGRLIKQLREAAGLTQDELATRVGWDTPKLVSEYEAGRRNATLDTVDRLLRALGVKRHDTVLHVKGANRAERRRPDEEALIRTLRRVDPPRRSLAAALVRVVAHWSRGPQRAPRRR